MTKISNTNGHKFSVEVVGKGISRYNKSDVKRYLVTDKSEVKIDFYNEANEPSIVAKINDLKIAEVAPTSASVALAALDLIFA